MFSDDIKNRKSLETIEVRIHLCQKCDYITVQPPESPSLSQCPLCYGNNTFVFTDKTVSKFKYLLDKYNYDKNKFIPSFYSSLYQIIQSQSLQREKFFYSYKGRILKEEVKYNELEPHPNDINTEERKKKVEKVNEIVKNELKLKLDQVYIYIKY